MQKVCGLFVIIMLFACKPVPPTYHVLMLDPLQTDNILLSCEKNPGEALCPLARKVRHDVEFLLARFHDSPVGFGLRIMHAQIELVTLQTQHASEIAEQAQREHIEELLAIVREAGDF